MVFTIQFFVAIILGIITPIIVFTGEKQNWSFKSMTRAQKITSILRLTYFVLWEILLILMCITGIKNKAMVDGKIIEVNEAAIISDKDERTYILRLNDNDTTFFVEVCSDTYNDYKVGDTFLTDIF